MTNLTMKSNLQLTKATTYIKVYVRNLGKMLFQRYTALNVEEKIVFEPVGYFNGFISNLNMTISIDGDGEVKQLTNTGPTDWLSYHRMTEYPVSDVKFEEFGNENAEEFLFSVSYYGADGEKESVCFVAEVDLDSLELGYLFTREVHSCRSFDS